MLQRQEQPSFGGLSSDDEARQTLTPSYLLDIAKRRAFHFLIPFILVSAIGSAVAVLWPATYLAEGKILVLSPQIPTNLVQPTVSMLASERIQVIEQRIMTRDKLLALAKKYHLTTGWRGLVSGTELVDFIRNRTVIEPVELASHSRRNQQAIAFNVGFRYEKPQVAQKVANELMTLILAEDARTRNSYAAETTQFLARDVERIEDQLSLLDSQIAQLEQQGAAPTTDDTKGKPTASDAAKTLAALQAQLAVKSATLSPEHPDIIALKAKIKSLEALNDTLDSAAKPAADKGAKPADKPAAKPVADKGARPAADIAHVATNATPQSSVPQQASSSSTSGLGLDTLETKRKSLQFELTNANQKLAAARLGESLELGQHAERLEVIEQPSLPDTPVSPNRPKLFAVAVLGAMMAGGGLAFAAEMLDQSVRRSADVFSLIDSYLVVSIPYITTRREIRRKRIKLLTWIVVVLTIIGGSIALAYFYLPPPDVLYDKLVNKAMGLLLK